MLFASLSGLVWLRDLHAVLETFCTPKSHAHYTKGNRGPRPGCCTMTARKRTTASTYESVPVSAARGATGGAGAVEQSMHSALVLPDLIDLVFKSLDCQSLCAAGSVCREWRKASQEEKYWTRLEFSSSSGHCSPDDSAMVSTHVL